MKKEDFELRNVYFSSKRESSEPLKVRKDGIWICVPVQINETVDNENYQYIEHKANLTRIEDWYKVIPHDVYRLLHTAWLDECSRLVEVSERIDIVEGAILDLADVLATDEYSDKEN